MFFKTKKFMEFLEKGNLNIFDVQSEREADLLRHVENCNGVPVQTLIAIQEDACIEVAYALGQCTNVMKREQMRELLNKLNAERKLKYYMREDGGIVASFIYWALDENFDCQTFFFLYVSFLKALTEDNDINKIMRIIWS